jgi:hypothetical protein
MQAADDVQLGFEGIRAVCNLGFDRPYSLFRRVTRVCLN